MRAIGEDKEKSERVRERKRYWKRRSQGGDIRKRDWRRKQDGEIRIEHARERRRKRKRRVRQTEKIDRKR